MYAFIPDEQSPIMLLHHGFRNTDNSQIKRREMKYIDELKAKRASCSIFFCSSRTSQIMLSHRRSFRSQNAFFPFVSSCDAHRFIQIFVCAPFRNYRTFVPLSPSLFLSLFITNQYHKGNVIPFPIASQRHTAEHSDRMTWHFLLA